jgi:hypothetical protein
VDQRSRKGGQRLRKNHLHDPLKALQKLDLAPLFYCERPPSMPNRGIWWNSRFFFDPDGMALDGYQTDRDSTAAKFKALPENHFEDNFYLSQTKLNTTIVSVVTFYIGEKSIVLGRYRYPAIFETLVIADTPDIDQWRRRYVTRPAARYGHRVVTETLLQFGGRYPNF